VGGGVLDLSSDLVPNKLVAGFVGSPALDGSVAGLGAKRDPKFAGAAEALDSNSDFLGASSFSLSDSPPVLSACSETGVDSFSVGLSCLAAPNRLDVGGFEANKELVGAEVAFPNKEAAWLVDAEPDGANLIGVVLGFQVWSTGFSAAVSSFSPIRTGCPSLSLVTRSNKLRPGVLSLVPGALDPAARPLVGAGFCPNRPMPA
jgi:hypothetical protein